MIALSAAIAYHAARTPDAPALIFDGETSSYAELHRRIGKVSAWLRSQDIGPGDIVAVLMRNSPAYIELAFAVSHLGAIFLPINFRLASGEVAYILADAGAALLLADDDLPASEAQTVPKQILDAVSRRSLAPLAADMPPPACHPSTPEDLFRIMYTSGTTDRPKGVMHSYANYHWKCADHAVVLGLSSGTRLLVVGPLYHVGAFDLPGMAVLLHGGVIVLLREFEPAQVLSAIETHRANAAWLAPVMTTALLSCPVRGGHDLSSLRWVIGGGERTPEDRIREFTDCFPNARYLDAYGLTESLSGDTFMEPGREIEKIGSTGRAVPHLDIAILDEAGQLLAAGDEGEICLRGPKVFRGYWRAPEKTAASFTDGWFRTGDLGLLDEDGYLFVTDRKKDMILSGGENIASSEVERVVQLIPGVKECAVVGVPDDRWGEVPVAVIVPRDGEVVGTDFFVDHCRAHLAGFKVPRRLVIRAALPRNPSGKVLKRQLREELTRSLS